MRSFFCGDAIQQIEYDLFFSIRILLDLHSILLRWRLAHVGTYLRRRTQVWFCFLLIIHSDLHKYAVECVAY